MILGQLIARSALLRLSCCLLAAFALALMLSASSTGDSEAPRDNAQLKLPLVNPKIVITKSKRMLRLYSDGKVVKTCRIGLGSSPIEDKIKAGDRRTPEGEFYICLKNLHSQFYLSLLLSYPNRKHADRGLRDGLITRAQYNQTINAIDKKLVPPQNTHLGGELFIHGNGSQSDWTWGCVALDDKDIRELFDAVPLGTPVMIEH